MHLSLGRINASGTHHFRTHNFNGHPEWDAILLAVEQGFELYAHEEGFCICQFMRDMALFSEYFPAL